MFGIKKKVNYVKEEFYCNCCGTRNVAYYAEGEAPKYYCGLCNSHDQSKPPIYDAYEAERIVLSRLDNIYLGNSVYIGNSKWEAVAQVTVELAGSGERVNAWRLVGEKLGERSKWKNVYRDKGVATGYRFDTSSAKYPKWASSTIRKFLNEVYYTENFTAGEKSRILKVKTYTPDNEFYFSDCEKNTLDVKSAMMGGPTTKVGGVTYSGKYAAFYNGDKYVAKGGPSSEDYVSILSLNEYIQYYEYYRKQHGYYDTSFDWCWLRTPGYPMTPFIESLRSKMVIIRDNGIPVYDGCIENDLYYTYSIRPVIYVRA